MTHIIVIRYFGDMVRVGARVKGWGDGWGGGGCHRWSNLFEKVMNRLCWDPAYTLAWRLSTEPPFRFQSYGQV